MVYSLFKTLFLIYMIWSSPDAMSHTHSSLRHRIILRYFAISIKLQWEYTLGLFTRSYILQLKALFNRCN